MHESLAIVNVNESALISSYSVRGLKTSVFKFIGDLVLKTKKWSISAWTTLHW